MTDLERSKRRRLGSSTQNIDETVSHLPTAIAVSHSEDTSPQQDPFQNIPQEPARSTESLGDPLAPLPSASQVETRSSSFDKTYRVQGIPDDYNRERTKETLNLLLKLRNNDGNLKLHSLATSPYRSTKVATISFRETPLCLRKGMEWPFKQPDTDDIDHRLPRPQIVIDSHFSNFTPLRTFESPSDHIIDCIAITGLGGHAFGSFKERNGQHMWLRDSLPNDLPGVRILIYGYDSHLVGSNSFQGMEALASRFRTEIAIIRETTNISSALRPLIFIAHSLGGLIVKEALIQMHDGETTDKANLNSTYGALFFGVPNQGMDISSLVPMVRDQPNRHLLESLGRESDLLRRQSRAFPKAFPFKDSVLYCFYETLKSPTAVELEGRWVMEGRPEVLVHSSSATHCRPWESDVYHIHSINKTHSELVKYSVQDGDYEMVLHILRRLTKSAVTVIRGRLMGREGLKVNTVLTEEQRKAYLDSLSFEQSDARFLDIKKAHDTTCGWLFEQPEYKKWLDRDLVDEHHGFLWIKGKPGAGKSIMMKHAFLKAANQSLGATIISFFFNARGSDLGKSILGMYRSLVHQLLTAIPSLQDNFVQMLPQKTQHSGDYEWTIKVLQDILIAAVKSPKHHRLVCFIDALDECEEDQVRELVDFLERLGKTAVLSGTPLNVCLSSRHYPHIHIQKAIQLTMEGQPGHDKDITTYVENKLKVPNSKQTDDIKAEILKRASGVFLWVVLVVQMLNKLYDHGQIHTLRRRLREIPDELDDLFTDILMRDAEARDQTILCLQWLLFTQKPLKREELYFAVLSGTEPTELGKGNLAEVSNQIIDKFILSCSKGLAEMSKAKDQRVQFIHESVRDFLLLRNGLARLQPDLALNMVGLSHEQLKRCCHQYIATDMLNHLFNVALPDAYSHPAKDLRETTNKEFPFLKYAKHNVFIHAEIAHDYGVSQRDFLREYEPHSFKMQNWIKLDSIFQPFNIRRYTPEARLHYILSEHNLPNLVQALSDQTSEFSSTKERYGSSIQAAAVNGHTRIVELLIEAGANVNVEGGEYSHALIAATVKNHDAVIKLLLDGGVNLNYQDRQGQTFLWWAARYGREAVVQLLLANPKVDPDSRDKQGRTPLWCASENGHAAVVKLLLESRNVDANSKDEAGQTPLWRAASRGHEGVVRLLLESGQVDSDSKNQSGKTPLSQAAFGGHEGVVKLLLDKEGVDLDSKDRDGETPLSQAASSGHEGVVKLLLDKKGVDPDYKDNNGQTPLSQAASRGHEGVVKLLLDKEGVDPDSEDRDGETPLSQAASSGHQGVVKLLLDKEGVDPDSKDKDGQTPLWRAASRGHEGVVRLLLESGQVDADSKNPSGKTPLSQAAFGGHEGVVKLLLESGNVDANSKDEAGKTPLQRATHGGHMGVVKLLQDKESVEPDSKDK